jgi:hypothetical protein
MLVRFGSHIDSLKEGVRWIEELFRGDAERTRAAARLRKLTAGVSPYLRGREQGQDPGRRLLD